MAEIGINMVQVVHEYTDDPRTETVRQVFWAVDSSKDYQWKIGDEEEWRDINLPNPSFRIFGSEVYVHDRNDINGLRALLNALEEEFDKADAAAKPVAEEVK